MNSDLADTLGNLLQRVTAKKLHPDGAKGVQLSLEMFHNTMVDEDHGLVDSLSQLSGVLNILILCYISVTYMYVCMYDVV